MITAYYLCHCGSGLSCFYDKIDLVKETDDSYTFHANAYDYKKCYFRIHTIKAKKGLFTIYMATVLKK